MLGNAPQYLPRGDGYLLMDGVNKAAPDDLNARTERNVCDAVSYGLE